MSEKLGADLAEIKADVKELIRQGAIHNELLRTHEARSLELKKAQDVLSTRIGPLEKHVDLVALLLKGAGAVLIFLAGQAILRLAF